MKKVVVESRLKGNTKENLRFALWCCRALLDVEGLHAIASHMMCPWFMDDSIEKERNEGIAWLWVWDPHNMHVFFEDLEWSTGMKLSHEKCTREGIPVRIESLKELSEEHWNAFQEGLWPPHTEGFEVAAQ